MLFFCYVTIFSFQLCAPGFFPAGTTTGPEFYRGKTNGVLPCLEYGLGSDRPGGAKMTCLDTGILVKVVDSTILNYKVQLSVSHIAYLPKANFQRDDSLRLSSYYLTNSCKVWGVLVMSIEN